MKLSQTGKFYTATVFMFLVFSSVLTILFPLQGELKDMYSILFGQASLFLALFISVAVLFVKRKKQGLTTLYFPFVNKNPGGHNVFAYLLIIPLSFVIIYGFNDINEVILYLFSRVGIKGSAITVFWTTPTYLVIALLLIGLTPALLEEIFIRGYCLDGMSGLKNKYAILLSALLFSVLHMNPAQTVYQFLLGIILALLVKISGKITYSILLHFCNNAFVVLFTYISESLEDNVVNLSFGLWSVAYAIAGIIGVSAIIFLFAYIFKRKQSPNETTLKFLKNRMNIESGDITSATKVEKMLFWGFFAIVGVVWVLNTLLLSM